LPRSRQHLDDLVKTNEILDLRVCRDFDNIAEISVNLTKKLWVRQKNLGAKTLPRILSAEIAPRSCLYFALIRFIYYSNQTKNFICSPYGKEESSLLICKHTRPPEARHPGPKGIPGLGIQDVENTIFSF